jgi:hypothetical protein
MSSSASLRRTPHNLVHHPLLKLLVQERMVGSLGRMDLKHAEEKNSPQFGSPKFPLQLISRG